MGLLAVGIGVSWAPYQDWRAVRELQSPDAQVRAGVAAGLNARTPWALDRVAEWLRDQTEPDAELRAYYVDALIRGGRSADAGALEVVARNDTSGSLRVRAWVGMARLDAGALARAAATARVADDWDRIGVAAGWLTAGDLRGVDVLLDWAARGDADQQYAASHALYHHVAPLLEAIGRWPQDANVGETDIWPAPLVAEVSRRCHAVDLQAIATDSRPHVARAAPVRHQAGRLNHARNIITRWLFRG